jgi:catechol 2,3-dioxygenase-like lactoylglutathione lyase family enzyme
MVDSKVIGFVATRDAARARRFYGEMLGLTLVSEDGFALVFDSNGTMVRVQKVEEVRPAGYTVLGWAVGDIGAKVKELTGRGMRFERFEGLKQDEAGVWTSPSGGRIAWFKDPDGNTLSLTQFDADR